MRILLAHCPLKHLLRLFAAAEPIQVVELGDTWHPGSGYVDQAIVAGVTTVGQLRAHEYDFGGLVCFHALLPEMEVRYRDEQYELRGPDKPGWRLLRRLEELNAQPDFQPKLRVLARHEDQAARSADLCSRMTTLRQLTDQLTQDLQAVYPAPEAASVAARLVEHLLGLDALQRRMKAADAVPAEALAQVAALLPRLLAHEPLQYVLGSAPFLDLDLLVTPATLIPRPETEELVELIAREQRGRPGLRILDVGTGSGCIPLALARQLPESLVWGLDFSAEALAVARQNGQQYAPQVQWLQTDILAEEPPGFGPASLDVLVSNPPYVRASEQALMRPNVLAFEPHSALFVPDEDPLVFYRRLAALGTTLLRPGGAIYFEINEALPEDTVALLTGHGYQAVRWLPDLGGRPRMVRASWPGANARVQADDV